MITVIQVEPFDRTKHHIFSPMKLAKQYCIGGGVEIGAAAHNPFDLDGSLNCAPWHLDPNHPWRKDFELYRAAQIAQCGGYAQVDHSCVADDLPIDDGLLNYVISSHVFEHIPSPVSALLEWDRVLKPQGIIFIIYPKRDALPQDRAYPVSTVEELISAYAMKKGHLEHHQDHHPWRFTPVLMGELVHQVNEIFGLALKVVASEETDSKVGNGHTIVLRKDE